MFAVASMYSHTENHVNAEKRKNASYKMVHGMSNGLDSFVYVVG